MRTKTTRGPRRGRISKRTKTLKSEPDVAAPSVSHKSLPTNAGSPPPPTPPASFKCTYEGCNRILKSKGGFTVHMRKHQEAANVSQRKPTAPSFRCTIDGCNRRYKRKNAFDKHMAQHLKDAVNPESPPPAPASEQVSPEPTTTDTSSASPVKTEVKSTDESLPNPEQLFPNKAGEEELISHMNEFSQALSEAFCSPFNVQTACAACLFIPPPPQPPPLPPLPPSLPNAPSHSEALDILLAQPPIVDQIYHANIGQLIQFL